MNDNKKIYDSPEVEIEKFTISSVITGSGTGGIGDYDNPVEPPIDF